ncbi:MAG TPA: hypothetical protein VJS88_05900, partial [Chthoniobacterales bacterium]|nr:hypothetical protein [Chthoniobacterales bacterium]
RVAEVVGNVCLLLAFVGLILAIFVRTAGPFFGCIALSGLLLGWLNASSSFKEGRFTNRPRRFVNRRSLGTDQRTALADLVLLTPVVALLVMAL